MNVLTAVHLADTSPVLLAFITETHMINRVRQALAKDSGFTLIELLVVVVIIGILAAVAIPAFLSQREKGFDASVKSDLRNASLGAESYYQTNYEYGVTEEAFAEDGVTALASNDSEYAAVTLNAPGKSGYAIFGLSKSGKVFGLSSWNNKTPEEITAITDGVLPATITEALADGGTVLKMPAEGAGVAYETDIAVW